MHGVNNEYLSVLRIRDNSSTQRRDETGLREELISCFKRFLNIRIST